ncbi:MAG: aminopeptidase P family N-terminal domain-containing protein, partial [Verrucomicrobiales bacterium]
MPFTQIPTLDPTSCRVRQDALRNLLAEQNLDAALLVNRHYVHALTGYWHQQPLTLAAVLVPREGNIFLAAPGDSLDAPAADEHIPYDPQELCTLVEDIPARLSKALGPALTPYLRIATTGRVLTALAGSAKWVDISCAYQVLRRKKDPDEIAILRHSIRAAEA